MSDASRPGRDARLPWMVVGGVVLAALSLRGPMVAPPSVLGDITRDTGLSSAAAGLLTSIPILCFALAIPLATRVIRRAGPEVAVVVCLLGVLAGTVLRSTGTVWALLAGTVVIGAAITIGNIVVPVVIRRDVRPSRTGPVTGAYTAALNIGSMATALGTAPLAAVVGWQWALASWGLVTVAGASFWLVLVRRRRSAGDTLLASAQLPAPDGSLRLITVLLTVAFAGQAFGYSAITAWLPTLLTEDRGLDPTASGAIASLFQVAAVIGALGVPVLAARSPAWLPAAAVGALWCALPVGLLLAPQGATLWAVVGGIAQGGGYTVIFSIVVRVTRSDREATAMSARVQTGGYLAAFAAPVLAGALHEATGSWTSPLLMVLVATLTYAAAGVLGAITARPRR